MQYRETMRVIGERFSWRRCMTLLTGIWAGDRWFSNDRFLQTAGLCECAFREAELSEVENLPLKADGQTRYGDWVIPRAWTARSATLRLVDSGEVLADYLSVPCSLSMYSAATPKEGIRAQVVPLDMNDLRGKLVLTSAPAKDAVPRALKGGAVGIISDYMPMYPGARDLREEMRGVSRWENDFILPLNDTGLFAFNLAPEKGDLLREAMTKGEVLLEANVETEAYDGVLPTVSACIPGSDQHAGEVLLCGHLYEPGANDNASGCALILETARCLQQAIEAGELPRPRRTIRFMMGHECGGSTGYMVSHSERRPDLALVADMVGSEKNDRSRLSIWHNPLASWSYMDDALIAVLEACREDWAQDFTWEERPFEVGTDNMLADPCWGMPAIGLITEPALSYHSSMDSPERIEESVMRRNAQIIGAAIYLAASRGAVDEMFLASLLRRREEPAAHPLLELMRRAAEKSALASLTSGPRTRITRTQVEALCGSSPAREGERIPVRKTLGCLTFSGVPDLKDSRFQPSWNTDLNLPLFWADGERTVWEIACLSGAERGDFDFSGRLNWLGEYFDLLERSGYLEWIETEECAR